ncbi:MAG: DNA primase [Desulfurococcales archaeon]|nr:DNA primase [Desulfurococcales archaeon]
MKYLIKARLEVDGRVDKHDVIGAIFGQTEGLLGSEFNLEELQKKDKIGRVHVDIRYQGTKTTGTITIPSNLDRVETAILAAMLETVDRIGPYTARITIDEIKDLRAEKIKHILKRSKEILKKMKEAEPDIREIMRQVQASEEEKPRLVEYGPEKLPAGPDVDKSDTVIIVEGRADVLNLLRYGYTNVIALEGAREKIPKTIIDLTKKKQAIALVDGDRGGELILKTLLDQADIDYVARAPKDMEVEELTGREIAQALEQMVPAETYKKKLGLIKEKPQTAPKAVEQSVSEAKEEKPTITPTVEEKAIEEEKKEKPLELAAIPKTVIDEIPKLKGSLEAILYDENWNPVKRISVRDLYPELQRIEPGSIYGIVFDGIITQRIIDAAAEKGVKVLIGARTGTKLVGKPSEILFFTFSDLT